MMFTKILYKAAIELSLLILKPQRDEDMLTQYGLTFNVPMARYDITIIITVTTLYYYN